MSGPGYGGVFGAAGAPGGSLPAGQFNGDVLWYDLALNTWKRDVTFPFITQDDWAVDSVAGNDANIGTAASPLQTPTELFRRINNKSFSPLLATVTITFNGVAFTEWLDLTFDLPGATNVLINGTMAAAGFTGTIDTYTGFTPGAGTRATILDAGVGDFTPFKRQRLRITTGAVAGAVGSFASVTALTTANVTQFYRNTPPETSSASNPANGDGYVIEDWATSFPGYHINVTGRGSVSVQHIRFVGTAPASRCYFSACGNRVRARMFGCFFDTTTSIVATGSCAFIACFYYGNATGLVVGFGEYQQLGCGCWSNLTVQGIVAGQSNIHDGDGLRSVTINLSSGSYVIDSNHRGFFGCINGSSFTSLALVQGGSIWDLSNANGLFWGATGNTTTTALNVQNSCGVVYVTKPTATGVAPGTDVILSGAAAVAWGAIPALAAAPNNAYVNVRQ